MHVYVMNFLQFLLIILTSEKNFWNRRIELLVQYNRKQMSSWAISQIVLR